MSSLVKPFAGYVPAVELAHRVVGPPTSMLSPKQRKAARKDPLSFRHSAGRKADRSHAEVVDWLNRCRDQGVLESFGPAVLIYRQTDEDSSATGLIADLSLAAYNARIVKPHENTIARTTQKMVDYLRTSRIYGNPTALAHRPGARVKARLSRYTAYGPSSQFTSVDGVSHQLWIVAGNDALELCEQYNGALYITDGHHRLAAASVVASQEGRHEAHIPVGLFSAEELRLRSFARCVADSDLDTDRVIAQLRSEHQLEEVDEENPRPRERFEFGVRIRKHHFRLQVDRRSVPSDAYEALDVNLLQHLILDPVFGIAHPDSDKRLSFVADTPESRREADKADAWILPYPAAVADVMGAADSGRVLPPKSTLFTPKLPSGLVIRLIDED